MAKWTNAFGNNHTNKLPRFPVLFSSVVMMSLNVLFIFCPTLFLSKFKLFLVCHGWFNTGMLGYENGKGQESPARPLPLHLEPYRLSKNTASYLIRWAELPISCINSNRSSSQYLLCDHIGLELLNLQYWYVFVLATLAPGNFAWNAFEKKS